MKILMETFIALALLIGAQSWASSGQSNIGQHSDFTQDSISLVGNDLKWNGSAATIDAIQSKIKFSYSLQVISYNSEFSQLMALLQIVKDSGIEDRLIRLDLFARKGAESEGITDLLVPDKVKQESNPEPLMLLNLQADGQLLLSDKPVELTDLTELLSADDSVSFYCIGTSQFSLIHEILQALDSPSRPPIWLMVQLRQQVKVEVKVVEILDDGTEKTLSAPSVTTAPGYMASMGVQDTQSQKGEDLYQQNGRSGGGVSLKLLPQFIGDYIKVTGSVALKRIKDSEAFQLDNESIRNYSAETTVVPFAYVFDEDTDTIKSDHVDVGGNKIAVYITTYQVSNQGERISAIGH